MQQLTPVKILYIEDDEDDFFLAREILEDVAADVYQIDHAATYNEGIEKTLLKKHDVYLIDFRLGQNSGLELITKARDKGIDKPIILMTNSGDRELDIAAMDAGADDYLSKGGLSGTVLERAIRYSINQRSVTHRMQESDKRLRDYIDTASDWLWEIDKDFRFSHISGEYFNSAGIATSSFIGKIRQETTSEDICTIKWRQHQDDLDNHRQIRDFVYELRSPDGERVIFRINGKPIYNLDGSFRGYRGTGTTVTEQKLVEEARDRETLFRQQLLATTQEGYWHIDDKAITLDVNPAMCRILDRPREDIIGKHIFNFLDAENTKKFKAEVATRREGKSIGFEIELQRSDGTNVPCINNATSIVDESGVSTGSVGMLTDISRQKEESKKLAMALEEAREASKAKSDFLRSMSHELRTPLNAVLGFAQIMQADKVRPLSQKQAEYVKHISEGGSHLLDLVNQVLDLAKIEADQTVLSLEEVNINEVIAECVALSIPLSQKRNITFIRAIVGNPGDTLLTDRLHFKQIFLNLLSNAIKYNKIDGSITIKGHKLDNGFLKISITDTGTGIGKSDHDKIFEMFHRLQNTKLEAGHLSEGTGIGLNVTKLLVEKMGGKIGLESELGVGSTFWIELPMVASEKLFVQDEAQLTGVEAIDVDHKNLTTLTNKISQRAFNGQDLTKSVQDLIDYTLYHFRREEVIMKVCGCPDLEAHQHQHEDLIRHGADLAEEWRKGRDPEILRKFLNFQRKWSIGHNMKGDKEIANYAEGKEIEIQRALEALDAEYTVPLQAKH